MAVNPDHIDFISSYCDRWCERCSFTHRCSAFTAMAAAAMCGDDRAGLELAFGDAPDDDGVLPPRPDWLGDIEPMSPQEEQEWQRKDHESEARVAATPIMKAASAFVDGARAWLTAHEQELSSGDEVVREALEVVSRDCMFIYVKLHRALDGKDRFRRDLFEDDDWLQGDSNGSAKIALLSIVRSTEAWGVLAAATGMATPGTLAAQLRDLREAVESEFPDAWKFRRPGFDGPHEGGPDTVRSG